MDFQSPNFFMAPSNFFFKKLYSTPSYISPKILVKVSDSPGNQYEHKRIDNKTGGVMWFHELANKIP